MNPQEILELAKKATPGPWITDEVNPEMVAGLDEVYNYICDCDGVGCNFTQEQYEANAQYIASLSPDIIIPLLERLMEIEKAVAIYCREELGDLNFESDEEAIEYFMRTQPNE